MAFGFTNGHAEVWDKDRKKYSIDKSGNVTESAGRLATIKNKDGNNGYIDEDVDSKGHYEDFVDEEKGEVISIWVEDPDSGE
jgi:hypothetical protein